MLRYSCRRVTDSGGLTDSMRYGNHFSAATHKDAVWKRLLEDKVAGRVVVVDPSVARQI